MDESTCYGTVLGEGAMSEYPPQLPDNPPVPPDFNPPPLGDLPAYTGLDAWPLIVIAWVVICMGLFMLFYVAKKGSGEDD